MQLAVAVLSRPGARQVNEDACGVWSGAGICVGVVSDGAGGHGGGDIASKLVVSRVLAWFRERPSCERAAIEEALKAANASLIAAQRNDPVHADMRATAVVLALDTERGRAAWGSLGDSRLYCFRDRQMIARTRDHSVLQRMVDVGCLEPEALRASRGRSQLYAALGDEAGFAPDVEGPQFSVQSGDAFLLCTDGCWSHLDERALAAALAATASPEGWLRALDERVRECGMPDQENYSAIAVQCGPSQRPDNVML